MTAPVKITKALALRLLKEAVEKKGADYIDPGALPDAWGDGCTYAKGNRPGCIVGHVLHGVGVKPKALREMDSEGGWIMHHLRWLSDRGVEITPAAVETLKAAQARQDDGETWGQALTAARKA